MAVKPIVTYDYTDQLNDDDVFIAAGEQVNTINALNASSDINNKVFGGYDAEASDSRIKSTIDDALSYAVDTRVAAYSSGDIAHITNGIKNGLFKSIKTSFNPTQKNKYDTTWIGGGDINKMPSIVRATKTGDGTSSITCQVIASNGVVRLTGEQGSTATTTFRLDFKDDEKRVKLPGNGTWQPQLYLHLNNSVADSKITVSLLYTPSSSTGSQRFDVTLDAQNKVSRINAYGIEGARLNRIEIIIRSQSVNFSLRPMITRSEENEAWRPFSNVCAINGYSGVTFTRCGKNLLENPQNVTVEAQKDEWTKYPICVLPLLPKGTYRLSYTQDKDITTNYYNRIVYAENGYSHSCPASLDSGRHSVPITVRDSSQVKIEWEARNVSDECHITDFQLEYADASSEYAEYEGDIYSVEFKIAGTNKKEYRGSFDLITGELVVTGTLVTLGDYNWRYNDSSKTFSCDHFADVIKTGRNKYATDILCSSYTPYSGSGTSPDRKYIRAKLKNGYIYIFDPDYAFFGATPTAQEIINRQNEFKASLASTTMFIPFAEPSIHRYSPATVKSFLGINNIWSDIGDIDVTYPLDLKAYVDHVISQYSVQTVSGPIAHYTNNFKRIPTKSVKVDIEPVQDLHGYDHPWPAGGGKNLCDPSKINTLSSNFIWYYKEDGFVFKSGVTYTFSVEKDVSSIRIVDYTNNDVVLAQANIAQRYVTYSPVSDVVGVIRLWATGLTIEGLNPQLELGSTATDYEPYSNICPITGWTGAKVTRTGKNLLNLSEWKTGSDSGITIGTDNISIINKGFQEKKNRYNVLNQSACMFSFHVKTASLSDSRASFSVYADGTTKLRGSGTTNTGNITLDSVGAEKDITITVPNGTEYISFGGWAWGGEVQISNVQIELGSTATDYEPYSGQTYDITFPTEAGTVYGGTLDVTKGELVVDRAIWTGNTADMNNGEDYPGWRSARILDIMGRGINNGVYNVITNISPAIASGCFAIGINTISSPNLGVLWLNKNYFNKNQTEWKAFALDIQVVLPLATPITYHLTPQEVTSLLGTNNVWADTGDIEVKYLTHTEA